jgi:hypothetical protein
VKGFLMAGSTAMRCFQRDCGGDTTANGNAASIPGTRLGYLIIAIKPLEKKDNAQNQTETENRLNELFGEPEHHRFI